MPNTLKIKRSSVASKVPATTDLQLGELAINTVDGRLYSKKNVSSVDSIIEFLSTDNAHKPNVVVATTANITLSAPQTIDGIAVVAGDRVLVKNQTTASQNGIYIVAAGAWTRSTDADASSELAGAIVAVNSGTANGGLSFITSFKSSNVLGTDAISFFQINGNTFNATTTSVSAVALTATSGRLQYFSGSSAQTVTLPDTSTLSLGATFTLVNGSSNFVTVQTSTSASVNIITYGHTCQYVCVSTAGNTAAAWSAIYAGASTGVGSGSSVFNTNPTLYGPSVGISSTVTASATNAQGQGTLNTTADMVTITTASANPSAVTLVSPMNGRRVIIVNRGANTVNVYPPTGVTIDNLAANAAFPLDVGEMCEFLGTSSTAVTTSLLEGADMTRASGTLSIANGGTNSTATPTNGGVNYGTGTAHAFTAAGTAGQALVSAGAAAPAWTTLTLENLPGAWIKKAVIAATTANVTLSGGAPNAIDGINLSANDRVLVKDQTATAQNGIYTVTTLGTGANGTWSRSADADTAAELAGATVSVDRGTISAGSIWTCYFRDIDTLGTTAVVFYKLLDTSGSLSYAPLASPAFTGTPTAPTAAAGTNTTQLATTGFVTGNFLRQAVQSDWSTLGTVSNAVGLLSWKNYGNNHVIFDASSGTSPSGGAVNNTTAAVAWTATYPTLMGWNGVSTYGVRVDVCRLADSVTTITTAQTLTAIAGASAGGVGTYGFLSWTSPGATQNEGTTVAGSSLTFAHNAGGTGGNVASGTWRLMGRVTTTNIASVFLRIA